MSTSRSNSFRLQAAFVFLALVLVAHPAQAVHEWYSISKSTRALGMGNAFYGLSDDESALFYNPAGLSLYEGGIDLMGSFRAGGSTTASSAMSTITGSRGRETGALALELQQFQGKPIFVEAAPAFGYYLRRGLAVGLLIADLKANATILGAGMDTSVDMTAIVDSGLFVGFAGTMFSPKLHLGMNLKGMVRGGGRKNYSVLDLAQGDGLELDVEQLGGVGFGVDADLGAMYEMPEVLSGVKQFAAISINNVLASKFDMVRITKNGSMAPQLPRMLTIGGKTVFPGFWKFDKVTAVLDLAEFSLGGQSNPEFGARTGSFWKHVNLGVEAPIRWFALRAGLHQGNITAGFGIDARYFQIDFATYAEEDAANPGRMSSRRLALRLAAGFGGAKPAVEPLRKDSPDALVPPVEKAIEKPIEKPAAVPEPVADPKADPEDAVPSDKPASQPVSGKGAKP